jgi:hypothetical protein
MIGEVSGTYTSVICFEVSIDNSWRNECADALRQMAEENDEQPKGIHNESPIRTTYR